jgi:hypothetical protein
VRERKEANSTQNVIAGVAGQRRSLFPPSQRLGLDENLERIGLGRRAERVVGVDDLVELEMMRDQPFGIDPVRLHSLEQHRRGDGVNEPGRNRDVAIPQALQMQVRLDAMHTDIGDDAARRHNILAGNEARRHADRFDGCIDAAAGGHLHDLLYRLAVLVVDDRRRAETGGQLQAVIIYVNHNNLGRRIELRREQGGEPDGAGANDGDGRARLNLAVEHAAFEAGGQDVTQHDERIFVRACGNVIETGIGKGNAHIFGLRAVDRVAEDPAAIDAVRVHAAAAIIAFSAGRDSRHDHTIADMKPGDRRPDFLDHTDALMA